MDCQIFQEDVPHEKKVQNTSMGCGEAMEERRN